MKKLILFAALFSMTISLTAQTEFGIKAGISTTDLSGKDFVKDDLTLKLKDAKYGAHFGVFLRAQGNRFFIQPEATLNSIRAEYQIGEENGANIFKEKYTNLDVPVLVGIKMGPLRLGAGPVGHINIGKSTNLADDGAVVSQDYEKLTFGYQAGLGLDIWRLSFDLRYEGNFDKFGDHIELGGTQVNLSQNASRLMFSMGYSF